MKRYQPDAPGVWGDLIEEQVGSYTSGHILLKDHCKLFLRSWTKENTDALLILHGLGGHGGWYVDMAKQLFAQDVSVYTVDHRGFGNSEGEAGHIDAYQQYVQDIAEVVTEMQKRHPTSKLYVLGHSMGGIFAAHFAATYGHLLSGVIFLNPWIQDTAQLPLATTLGILLGGAFKSHRLWRVGGGHEGMTANPEAIRMLQADPYWVRALTATFFIQILRMRLAAVKKAKSVTIPALVLQAEADKVVVAAAAHRFYDALASSDKTWKNYPDWYHDTEFEEDRSLLDADIVHWIKSHR